MESLSLCCYGGYEAGELCRESQSGFRISEFQHRIGGTKPRQSLTRRAKFDEMCDVALDLDWTPVHFEDER